MNNVVKQNLKRIATELLERFDFSEVDDLLLDIEEIEQALTPPTADEIVKELNEYYEINNVKYGRSPQYSNGSYALRFTSNDNGLRIFAEYDVKSKSINISGYIDLKLAHKITSFFMEEEL